MWFNIQHIKHFRRRKHCWRVRCQFSVGFRFLSTFLKTMIVHKRCVISAFLSDRSTIDHHSDRIRESYVWYFDIRRWQLIMVNFSCSSVSSSWTLTSQRTHNVSIIKSVCLQLVTHTKVCRSYEAESRRKNVNARMLFVSDFNNTGAFRPIVLIIPNRNSAKIRPVEIAELFLACGQTWRSR